MILFFPLPLISSEVFLCLTFGLLQIIINSIVFCINLIRNAMIEKVEISTTNQTILDLRELKDTLERNQDRELQKKLFEIKESDTYSNRSVDRLERFIIFDGQDYFLEFFPAY
jgi:chromosome condensin MukBEF complex kleisin-like MukF subunit